MKERRSVFVLVYAADPPRVLLLRRPEARAAGWQSVTGGVEACDDACAGAELLRGEPATPEVPCLVAACVREIAEETGLPRPLEVLDLDDERAFLGYNGDTYRQRSFAARYAEPVSPPATPEHEEARWVAPDEADRMVRWESDRVALRAVFPTFFTDSPAPGKL